MATFGGGVRLISFGAGGALGSIGTLEPPEEEEEGTERGSLGYRVLARGIACLAAE